MCGGVEPGFNTRGHPDLFGAVNCHSLGTRSYSFVTHASKRAPARHQAAPVVRSTAVSAGRSRLDLESTRTGRATWMGVARGDG